MKRTQALMSLAGAGALTVGFVHMAYADAASRAIEEAKKYAGTTIQVTYEAGLQALGGLQYNQPKFMELTGVDANTVELPLDELFTKPMIEHRAGTGAYDVLNLSPAWIPDMAEAGVIEDLDPYIDKYGVRSEFDDINPVFRAQCCYKGKTYGLPDDGDVFILYYRTDVFDELGLKPPKTWAEFAKSSQLITDKKGPDIYGSAAMHGVPHVHYFYQDRFRHYGGKFFDAETMKATVSSPAGVEALTTMIATMKSMPPGVEAWGFGEGLNAMLSGQIAMWVSWPPVARWAQGVNTDIEALSWLPQTQVADKIGYAVPPNDAPQLAAGQAFSLSTDSGNKDIGYLFMQWAASKAISLERVQLPVGLRDPYRISHYEDPGFRSLWPRAGEYLDAAREGAAKGLLDLTILNTAQYELALAQAVAAAISGLKDPKEALEDLDAEWDGYTETIGVDKQRAAYETWAAKAQAYPDGRLEP